MNNGSSRIINSLRNSYIAMIGQGANIILQFLLRTVFIKTLGLEYLGVNGLFTNILSVLSLAELGLGTTIIYSLYKPLAEKDTQKIKVLFKAFKKIYMVIGIVIFILGISSIPFLNYLIKDTPKIGNLNLIYILFVIDSAVSYFFAHYRSLLNADQKGYMDTINKIIFTLIQILFQIITLFMLRNYYIYLLIRIVTNIISGYALSLKAKKNYLYLNEKTKDNLTSKDLKDLIKNSIAMFSHKIGFVVLNSTDSIIISSYVGIIAVGLYSNYLLLISTISTVVSLIVAAIQASVGNLSSSIDKHRVHDVFLNLNFVLSWIYGFCAICLYVLLSPFIVFWIGESYLIGMPIVIMIVVNFYIQGMRQSVLVFTTANGLFYNMRFKPIIEVLINLTVSIIFVQSLGIFGVFLGTFISTMITSFWYEPYTLYSEEFKKSTREYFSRYLIYTTVHVISAFITKYLCELISNEFKLSLMLKIAICLTVPNLIYFIIFSKTNEFKYIKNTIRSMLNKRNRDTYSIEIK